VRCEPVREIQNQENKAQKKKEIYGRGVVLSPGMPGRNSYFHGPLGIETISHHCKK
jgi:hypothetical protein